jgi:SAM-dependent methyltransferase
VIAGLVGRYVPDMSDAVFDAGVGTGTVGKILAIIGYGNLIGVDMSDGMLARAKARRIYTDLRNRVLGEPLDFPEGSMAAIVSTGVFTTGHGPAHAWDELTRITRAGGHLIFTVGTVVWQEQGFAKKFDELCGKGLVEPVEPPPSITPCPIRPRNQVSPQEPTFIAGSNVFSRERERTKTLSP